MKVLSNKEFDKICKENNKNWMKQIIDSMDTSEIIFDLEKWWEEYKKIQKEGKLETINETKLNLEKLFISINKNYKLSKEQKKLYKDIWESLHIYSFLYDKEN